VPANRLFPLPYQCASAGKKISVSLEIAEFSSDRRRPSSISPHGLSAVAMKRPLAGKPGRRRLAGSSVAKIGVSIKTILCKKYKCGFCLAWPPRRPASLELRRASRRSRASQFELQVRYPLSSPGPMKFVQIPDNRRCFTLSNLSIVISIRSVVYAITIHNRRPYILQMLLRLQKAHTIAAI
jgi:hypothetical protein